MLRTEFHLNDATNKNVASKAMLRGLHRLIHVRPLIFPNQLLDTHGLSECASDLRNSDDPYPSGGTHRRTKLVSHLRA